MAEETKEYPKEVEGKKVEIRSIMEMKDYFLPGEINPTDVYMFVVAVEGITPLFHIVIPKEKYSTDLLKEEIKKKIDEYLKGLPKL